VHEDRPHPAEHDERQPRAQVDAEEDRREVHERLGVEPVERVLAVGGKPVDVTARVVDRVEAPEEGEPVLRAVPQ
jgi:hypothetical protein